MSGLVGIISNDAGRFSLFPACMVRLQKWLPEDAKVEWLIGGDWCGARNDLARQVLADGHDWLWFMDDDHAFPPDMLLRLLGWDLPLVTPICLTRVAPFLPVQFTERDPDADKRYKQIPLVGGPQEGLVKLEAGGCAGMLIRREVLESVPEPWFEYGDRSEDIIFCEKARDAGFDLYCDVSLKLGHITTAVVEPAIVNGEWCVGLTIGRNLLVSVPFETQEVVP